MATIALLTLLSALRHGAYFYHYLDSDMAIHVLMARGFEMHYNLWYWGQTRLGSLLPMLAFLPWKVGLDPLKAVTIVQYAMVSSCIVLFGLCVRNVWATLLFALIFLFPSPPDAYLLVPGHPYLPHLMLTLAGIFVMQWFDGRKLMIDSGLILVFWTIGLLAVWVSDMALVTVPVIYVWRLAAVFGTDRRKWSRSMAGWTVVMGPVALFLWTGMLKRQAIDWSGYSDKGFVGADGFLTASRQLLYRADQTYFHLDHLSFTKVALVSVILLGATGVLHLLTAQMKVIGFRRLFFGPIAPVLSVLGLLLFLLTLSSAWAAQSGYDGRYFCLPALLLGMAAVAQWGANSAQWYKIAVPVLSILTAAAGFGAFGENWYEGIQFRSDCEGRGRIEAMRKATILGDYWYCYVMASYNCNEVIPMAFDDQFYRNSHQVDAAFLSDSIFICTDPRHPSLPDTVAQHGRTLIRCADPPFKIGNTSLGRYLVIHQPEKKQPKP